MAGFPRPWWRGFARPRFRHRLSQRCRPGRGIAVSDNRRNFDTAAFGKPIGNLTRRVSRALRSRQTQATVRNRVYADAWPVSDGTRSVESGLIANLRHRGCEQKFVAAGRVTTIFFEDVSQDRIEISTGTGRETEGHSAVRRFTRFHALIQPGAEFRPEPSHVRGTGDQFKASGFDVGLQFRYICRRQANDQRVNQYALKRGSEKNTAQTTLLRRAGMHRTKILQ